MKCAFLRAGVSAEGSLEGDAGPRSRRLGSGVGLALLAWLVACGSAGAGGSSPGEGASGTTSGVVEAIGVDATPVCSFPAPRQVFTGGGPWAQADFNGDGKADLLVSDASATRNALYVLLGNGDGTFQPATHTTWSSPSIVGFGWPFVADMDGDGRPDVVFAADNVGAYTANVMLGNGDGTFAPPVSHTVTGAQPPVVAGDFNGDGKQDLASADCYGSKLTILLGKGGGAFAAPKYVTGNNDRYVAIHAADLNADGKLDLVLLSEPQVDVFLGNGDGTFQAPKRYPTTTTAWTDALGIADFNGDGHLDLAAGAAGTSGGPAVSILLGVGDGTFGAPQSFGAGLDMSGLTVADFNHDGVPDVAGGGNPMSIFLGDGAGGLRAPASFLGGVGAVADFDGDGIVDVAGGSVGFSGPSFTRLAHGNGDGTLADFRASVQPTYASVVAADFNGDGRTDLASTSYDVAVSLGNGDGTVQAPTLTTSAAESDMHAIDLNGDGVMDLIALEGQKRPIRTSRTAQVMLGKGDGTFTTSTLPAGFSPVGLVGADFTGDGKVDLAWMQAATVGGSLDLWVHPGNGDGTFAAGITTPLGREFHAVRKGDLNHDGKMDLIASESTTGSVGVTVLLGQGGGTFAAPVTYAAGANPGMLALGDVTGDGNLDVAVASGPTLRILHGDGTGALLAGAVIKLPAAPSAITLADVTGSRALDVLAIDPNNLTVLQGRGNGTFLPAVTYAAAADTRLISQTSLVAPDLNGDGRADVAFSYAGSLYMALNSCH